MEFKLVTRFIDYLYTGPGTTSNYSTTAKPFQTAVFASLPWEQPLTVEILQLHALRFCLHSLLCRTQLTLSLAYNISERTTLKHPISNNNPTVACVFVAVGTCLTSRCP
jgi:hypothetical protein